MQDTFAPALREYLKLKVYDHFPSQLRGAGVADLWRHLACPSLFHIKGRRPEPLFVSVLLHGNEDTGWDAIQLLMAQYEKAELPRSLLLLAGNIEAAKANVRTLPGQLDYNRVWPGTLHSESDEAAVMRDVMEYVRAHAPFASIDIHNNTGNNPYYGCVNVLHETHLHLARLFSRTVVYFTRPLGVQSSALAPLCPAVTIECGRPGVRAAAEHAAEFVHAALSLSHFPDHAVPDHDIDLLQTFAIVKVPPEGSFSFDGSPADFQFRSDLDRLNFSELGSGVAFGTLDRATALRLSVEPGDQFETAQPYFTYEGGDIQLSQPVIPAMLTLDPRAVRLDCLGYLMHRIGRDGRRTRD
jgi:hypothetical protein